MNSRPPAILDHLSALADTIRSRILLLLDRHELSVTELCAVMQLPQSTVSRHLKALSDSGWIASRAEGTSNVYTMARDGMDAAARRLWLLVREQVGATPAATQDELKIRSQFTTIREGWDRMNQLSADMESCMGDVLDTVTMGKLNQEDTGPGAAVDDPTMPPNPTNIVDRPGYASPYR